jgi:hypothetical protein
MPGPGEPKVRVEEVTFPPIRHERLTDRRVEHPPPSDTYALAIRGWAGGNRQSVTHFELMHRGMVLETVPAQDEGGLTLNVSALDLPYRFRVVVRAVLEDNMRAPVAALSGTRAPLPEAPASGASPVLITMIGRSGSTAVSNLLCHHPDFAGYRTWDTETHVVSYWTAVLRALARPASYERQLQADSLEGSWWLDDRASPAFPADEPGLPALAREGVEAIASFCRAQIGLTASSLATAAGRPEARYFVEKAQPDQVRSVAEVAMELDPRAREIVLVRDFRDVVCSMLAYSRKKGFRGFGPRSGASVEETIRWLSFNGAGGLTAYAERRGARAHLLRYEDLITHPAATLTDVLAYIGVDARPQTVAAMLEGLAAERERRDSHATSDSAQRSIGRWREELDPDQQALAEHLFRPHLDALGYE